MRRTRPFRRQKQWTRGSRRSKCKKKSPGRWISTNEWDQISEEDKECIRTAWSNYAKYSIGAVGGAE